MVGGNAGFGGEVSDGAGDFKNAVVSTGTQVVLLHRQFQEFQGRFRNGAKFFQFPAAHPRVASDFASSETFLLNFARSDDAGADHGRSFTGPRRGYVAEL